MTKNERIAKLEAEVEELKRRPQTTYVFPVYPALPPPLPYYLGHLWGSENTNHPNFISSQFLGVGGGL